MNSPDIISTRKKERNRSPDRVEEGSNWRVGTVIVDRGDEEIKGVSLLQA